MNEPTMETDFSNYEEAKITLRIPREWLEQFPDFQEGIIKAAYMLANGLRKAKDASPR